MIVEQLLESGNRWLQGFHAFQALGRFATSVHRLEPPDEPSLQSSAWRPNDCLKMPFSAAVGTFATCRRQQIIPDWPTKAAFDAVCSPVTDIMKPISVIKG